MGIIAFRELCQSFYVNYQSWGQFWEAHKSAIGIRSKGNLLWVLFPLTLYLAKLLHVQIGSVREKSNFLFIDAMAML